MRAHTAEKIISIIAVQAAAVAVAWPWSPRRRQQRVACGSMLVVSAGRRSLLVT